MEDLDIVKFINSENLEREGNKILENNDFFQKLVYIMNNDVFKKFYETYCTDKLDITVITTYMSLYIEIEQIYLKKYNKKIPSTLIVKILHNIFTDNKLRKYAFLKYASIKMD